MSAVELQSRFKGIQVTAHLPEDGMATLNSSKQQETILAVLPFAHPGFDGGPTVILALGPAGHEVLMPLELDDARRFASIFNEAIQQAEKLQ